MKPIKPTGQKWLKCFHVFFSALWVVGVVTLALMNLLLNPEDAMSLHGTDLAKKFIDDFIIIPGAVGCFSTALVYSCFTRWGWLRHRWITAKWAINLAGLISGAFWLAPWIRQLPEISRALGIAALKDPTYQHLQSLLVIWGTAQALLIVFAAAVAIWKPWRRRRRSPKDDAVSGEPTHSYPARPSQPIWHIKH